MDLYQPALITMSISLPMYKMGGDIKRVLTESIRTLEGKCSQEGYIKKGSSTLYSYSCGLIKGPSVIIQVVFDCKVANPMPGQVLPCIVEHNTRAGIKARLQSNEDSPFVIFLARDHHNLIPGFSDIQENEKITVVLLGQRFEINDPKIYIIATLQEEVQEPKRVDILILSITATSKPPGRLPGEEAEASDYVKLNTRTHWRKELSPYHESEFTWKGSHGIVFTEGRWKTLQHCWNACKLFFVDKEIANQFQMGKKYGEVSTMKVKKKGTEAQLNQWKEVMEGVMYDSSIAYFKSYPSKMEILCDTKPALLMHKHPREPEVRLTCFEKVRELC